MSSFAHQLLHSQSLRSSSSSSGHEVLMAAVARSVTFPHPFSDSRCSRVADRASTATESAASLMQPLKSTSRSCVAPDEAKTCRRPSFGIFLQSANRSRVRSGNRATALNTEALTEAPSPFKSTDCSPVCSKSRYLFEHESKAHSKGRQLLLSRATRKGAMSILRYRTSRHHAWQRQ